MSISNSSPFTSVITARVFRLALIAISIAGVFSYLDLKTNVFGMLEQPAYGLRLEVAGLLRPDLNDKARANIAVIGVSGQSFRWAGQGDDIQFMPRTVYAQLINVLTACGAKVIAFDINFGAAAPGDASLVKAIKKSGRVLIASFQDYPGGSINYPEKQFVDAGCQTGIGLVRAVDGPGIDDAEPLLVQRDESGNIVGVVPQFDVAAVRVADGLPASLPLSAIREPLPGKRINLDPRDPVSAFKIRFLRDPDDIFTPYPIEKVLAENEETNAFNKAYFKNKIVLVGDTRDVDHDSEPTPVGEMFGVLINAHTVATLLNGRFIHKASAQNEILFLSLLVILTTVLSSTWSLRRLAVLIVLVLPIYFLINVFVFVEYDYYVHLAASSIAVLLTAFWILLDRGLTEENEKANFRGLLQRYVNPKIADHILKYPELIGGGGRRQVGTVLFSDIRGFTQMSEELPTEDLVARVNEYFQVMTDIVFNNDGTAVSFVGDGMLAVFGIPIAAPDHADRAVKAAIEMQSACRILDDKWHSSRNGSFSSGIGINSGDVIFGEIGGKHLRSFTVYGLQVNIASRIEGANKELGTKILMTASTFKSLQSPVKAVGPTQVTVKGVNEPVIVYQVIDPFEEHDRQKAGLTVLHAYPAES